jgi:hypothetical protein
MELTASRSILAGALGWSLLLDVSPLGLRAVTASRRLLELGKIAATPMIHRGSAKNDEYVRFVLANEPVHRLRGVAERAKQAPT